jgi:HPt (histidine-containing phosphotransfer) domain-containing protein
MTHDDPIDWDKLTGLRELQAPDEEGDIVLELIEIFLEESERHLTRLEGARDRRDFKALEQIAHTLRGSAGSLAATRLLQVGADVEAAAVTAGDQTDIGPLIDRLAASTNEAREALRAFASR